MSDNVLRLIPEDPRWAPDEVVLRRATDVVRDLVPGAESVHAERYDDAVFVDAGGNSERVECFPLFQMRSVNPNSSNCCEALRRQKQSHGENSGPSAKCSRQ